MRPFSDVDLHAFVDGQVSAERRALIETYLRATPSEAARVDQWRRQNEAIRGVFAGTVAEPVPLWLTIGQVASGRERSMTAGLDPVQDNRAQRQPGPRRVGARVFGVSRARAWLLVGLVVSAFLAGVAVPYAMLEWPASISRWLPATPHMEQLQRLANRTAEAHRTFGSDPDKPVEVLDVPSGTLAGWFRRHAGFPVRVPDLRRAGWSLRGGRIAPGDLGPAALMVYEDSAGDRLSLVAARVSNAAPADTSFAVLDGTVLAWLDGPVGFGMASSLDGTWLTDNAPRLYRAVYEGATD